MPSVTPLSAAVLRHKQEWLVVGRKILDYYAMYETIPDIGRCIDLWKSDHRVPEDEMLNGLGFLLGELIVGQHSGTWVWVCDEYSETPAIQRMAGGGVTYILDVVSKRLRDDSEAARELPTIADFYATSA